MIELLPAFLQATLRTATPLGYAAIGELLVERAGLVNIGLEGVMLAGAFGALVGATAGDTVTGYAAGALAGTLTAAILGAIILGARAGQIVVGTAITLLSLGVTGTLYREIYGTQGAALGIPTSAPVPLGPLARLPLVGPALFEQPIITYALYAVVPLVWLLLYRTHLGLAWRAVGEDPEAAEAAGIRPRRMRFLALLAGGALGGLGGATLVLAQAGTFAEGMTAGRGFLAIAIVALGRWHPGGVAAAAVIFGATSALQYLFQAGESADTRVPYQVFLALPYALTLIGLATLRAGRSAPAALGRDERS